MKLVGSKTEQDFREMLIKSHNLLFEGDSFQQLLLIINHIPEQGEDLYTTLVNIDIIVILEISHHSPDESVILQAISVNEFKKGPSKIEQKKLAVALDLAKSDISNNK